MAAIRAAESVKGASGMVRQLRTGTRPNPATAPDDARRRPRRRWGWLAALARVAALAWIAVAPPPAPATGARLSAFEPARLANLEQEAWEAYYYRQWPRLFWLM